MLKIVVELACSLSHIIINQEMSNHEIWLAMPISIKADRYNLCFLMSKLLCGAKGHRGGDEVAGIW